jgi:adenine-specific DNA-methyltransferase
MPPAKKNVGLTDNYIIAECYRKENSVKFIRLKKKIDLKSQIYKLMNIEMNYETDSILINKIKQKDLTPGKWSVYLRAPSIYSKIIEKKMICELSQVAHVIRAPTTGNNEFFILDKFKLDQWNIEKEYLKPCLSSPKEIEGMVVNKTENYMLFVNNNKDELQGKNVLKYIKYGENLNVEVKRGSKKGIRKLPEIETLKTRKPYWYSLPEMEAPPILFPRLIDRKPVFLKNEIKANTTHVFYYIYPIKSEYETILLAFLNSSIAAFFIELNGRSYGGGVLELLVYEIEKLPILNPSILSANEVISIVDAYSNLKHSTLDNNNQYQRQLDEVIFDIFKLTKTERLQIVNGLNSLQEIRRARTML